MDAALFASFVDSKPGTSFTHLIMYLLAIGVKPSDVMGFIEAEKCWHAVDRVYH